MYHYLLDKNWEYAEIGLQNPLMVNMISNWKKTNLPHDYAMEKERNKNATGGLDEGFTQGAGLYYKKSFELSTEAANKRIWLEFEGVAGITEVWVNGKFAAKSVNPYISFSIDITKQVKTGENIIFLHTDSSMKPSSRWYVGTGLYRSVWLHAAEMTAVSPHGLKVTTRELDGDCAVLDVHVNMTGSGVDQIADLSLCIEKNNGVKVAETAVSVQLGGNGGSANLEIPVVGIIPWSPESPELYKVKVTANGIDTYTESIGIRTVRVNSRKGFLLNGKSMKLKGGCIHHDFGILGAADHEAAEYRRVKLLKESGYNALRLSHNPFSPTIFKVCDELGMLVVEEAFDEWVLGRTSFGSHIFFEDRWERDLEAMITRDYNHPSIIMWSTGNEVEERDGSADGFAWSKRLADKVRLLDNTRPVSATACSLLVEYTQRPSDKEATTGNQALNMAYDNFASGVDLWGDTTAKYFAPLDVAGYNYKNVRYEHDSKKFPDRVIYGSESYPRAAFSSWQTTVKNDNVIGDFVWTAWDYLGEVGVGRWEVSEEDRPGNPEWPWISAYCSDIDLIGEKRPQSYYRDAVWENDYAPHLFTLSPELTGKHLARLSWAWLPVSANYTFPGAEGQDIEAHIYANADEVELYVNGRSLGRKACSVNEEYKAVYTFTFEPGTIEAAAYKNGVETGRDILRTASVANKLNVTADRNAIKSDGRDLSFIKIEAVDAAGNPVVLETGIISVEVQGGEVIALGTADPRPDRLIPYKENKVPLYEGKALAVVRSVQGGNGCLVKVKLEDKCEADIAIRFIPAAKETSVMITESKAGALELPLGELLENEAAFGILKQMVPELIDNPMIEHMKRMSLKKMEAMGGTQYDTALVEKLNQIMGL